MVGITGRLAGLGVGYLVLALVARAEDPQRVSACDLKNNPSAYNHKLVEVTALASWGFENFSLSDPACSSGFSIWLEYGGTIASGTSYCCGVSADRSRSTALVVEGIQIALLADRSFREFDRLVRMEQVRATIVARFFAGGQDPEARGYGHFGCCSLLAIQQVLSVSRPR